MSEFLLVAKVAKTSGLDGKEVSRNLVRVAIPVNGGLQYQLFVGPKEQSSLEMVRGAQLQDVIDYGMFSVLVRPLLVSLKWLYGYVRNYGAAIVLLTLLLTLLLFPFRLKQIVSMKKMAVVQPKIKAIQEKYKLYKATDPKRAEMNQEVMAVYKEHHLNPLGGCLPLLLQMPILLGLSPSSRAAASWWWRTSPASREAAASTRATTTTWAARSQDRRCRRRTESPSARSCASSATPSSAPTRSLPGVTIGEGAAVGAGSVVTRDLAPWKVYAGAPCRPIKERPRERMLELERQLRAELYDAEGRYIPRERNKEADALANKAIDEKIRPLRAQITAMERPYRESLRAEYIKREFPENVQRAVFKPEGE